jgi:hypothetical protein
LNKPFGNRGERNIGPNEKAPEGGGIDDKGARMAHVEVVMGNDTRGEAGKGQALGRGQIGLLETDNICPFDETFEGVRDFPLPGHRGRFGTVVGETIDIVGEDGGNTGDRGGEGERGEGTHRRAHKGNRGGRERAREEKRRAGWEGERRGNWVD